MTPSQHDQLSNGQRDALAAYRDSKPARALNFRLFDDIATDPLAKRWVFKGIM